MLYQQNAAGTSRLRIRPEHFSLDSVPFTPRAPVVLSVDPGLLGGATNSFSVIQAWTAWKGEFHLVDQWRDQCRSTQLRKAFRHFARLHHASVALIEATANGPSLIDEVSNGSVKVIQVPASHLSKYERLLPHIRKIRAGKIFVPEGARWLNDLFEEFANFPRGPFTDQVDTATLYWDYMAKRPLIPWPRQRAMAIAVNSRSEPITAQPSDLERNQGPGIARSFRHRTFF